MNILDDERFYIIVLIISVVVIFFIGGQKSQIVEVNVQTYDESKIKLDGVLPDYKSSNLYEIIDVPETTEMIKEKYNIGRNDPFKDGDTATSKKVNPQLP